MRCRWVEVLCLAAAWGAAGAAGAQAAQPLVGVWHVRSSASGGAETVEALASRAAAQGIDVLVLADPYHLSLDYGVPFLRRLLRVDRALPSLATAAAVADWLGEVERVGALYPDVVIVPGLECAPFYWWDLGSGRRQWSAAGLDQRLVVLGLEPGQVERLPVAGTAGLRVWHWSGLLLLLPLCGLAYVWVARHRHPRWLRWGVGAVSAVCLVANAPFTVPLWDGYNGDLGVAPYQRFIDQTAAEGAVVVWTMPRPASPASLSLLGHSVQLTSRPWPSDLLAHTRGWSAFAGLCGTQDRAVGAGQAWDQLLAQLARGERDAAVWVMGERGPDAAGGDALGDVQTVVWADERTPQGVLQALRGGRAYARRGTEPALVLEDFVVRTEEGEARSGAEARSRGRAAVRARVGVTAGRLERLQVQLIRDGQVVVDRRGAAPLEVVHRETGIEPGRLVCYRLLAQSKGGRLVSNPVFVRGAQP